MAREEISPLSVIKFKMKSRLLLLTILYSSLILASSLIGDSSSAETEAGLRAAIFNFLHIPAYTVLTVLLVVTFKAPRIPGSPVLQKKPLPEHGGAGALGHWVIFAFAFTLAVSFGVLNEFIQAGVPGRF
ncbi:MAG: hypothetical protein AB1650_06140 [Candidatus Omnitrophota bacterium]